MKQIKKIKDIHPLVVDDFEPIRQSIARTFKDMGVEKISLAGNGQEAMDRLEIGDIDCIISDWNMPKVDGLELLHYVRETKRFAHLPFMMVTGEIEVDHVNMAVAAGVSEFLIKPFSGHGLRLKIESMLTNPLSLRERARADPVVAPQALTQQVSPKRLMPQKSKATILIVDDTPSNIDVISGVLKGRYSVKAATGGDVALNLVRSLEPTPDLILLDIMMPGMDGMEVCKKLKEDPETAHIPIIFLSALSDVADITAGFEAGGADYVTKPANPDILLARVATQLKLKDSRDALSQQIETLVDNGRLREDVERMTRHDIKNPLATILSSTESILEGEWMSLEQTREVEVIRNASLDILKMINSSLDLYKMEVGSYRLKAKPIDIVAITQRVVCGLRFVANKKGITVRFEAPDRGFIKGEKLLCVSLLGNLINNAVEASPKSELITVNIECEKQTSITIHNVGEIPEDIQESFFEKYATSGKETGTGLGTYSARLMTEIQGGKLAFETSAEAGTTLRVTFRSCPLG